MTDPRAPFQLADLRTFFQLVDPTLQIHEMVKRAWGLPKCIFLNIHILLISQKILQGQHLLLIVSRFLLNKSLELREFHMNLGLFPFQPQDHLHGLIGCRGGSIPLRIQLHTQILNALLLAAHHFTQSSTFITDLNLSRQRHDEPRDRKHRILIFIILSLNRAEPLPGNGSIHHRTAALAIATLRHASRQRHILICHILHPVFQDFLASNYNQYWVKLHCLQAWACRAKGVCQWVVWCPPKSPAKERRHHHVAANANGGHLRRPHAEPNRQMVSHVAAGGVTDDESAVKVNPIFQPSISQRLRRDPLHGAKRVVHSRREPVLRSQPIVRRHHDGLEAGAEAEAAAVAVGPRARADAEAAAVKEEDNGETNGGG
nr:hypothetical protein DVH24_005544 [Ipomoea batatas]